MLYLSSRNGSALPGPLVELGKAHRLTEPPACFEGVAVCGVSGRDMRAGQQQPLPVTALVLAVILQQALRDFLVVRIVAEPRRHQRQTLDQRSAVLAAIDISLGPG